MYFIHYIELIRDTEMNDLEYYHHIVIAAIKIGICVFQKIHVWNAQKNLLVLLYLYL